jgi:predicted nuclease of predicted toxin-antitoxin system
MKFLLDQDVYALTARFLREQGHDVVTASELGMSRAQDEQLLKTAGELGRVFVTRDRDYGNLVFKKSLGNGVIYLRVLPSELNQVHDEMGKVLSEYTEEELVKLFVVIEADGHRVRKNA